jgi:hypothetical protein
MSRARSAKSSQIQRTRFVPSTGSAAPLLQLRTGGITTEGRTQLHTCYVPAPSLPVFNSLDTGSDGGLFCGGDWDESSLEPEGSQQILCEPLADRRKRSAAVSAVAYVCYSHLITMPQDTPLLAWIPERQTFLDETLRLEGRGTPESLCCCGLFAPHFRCRDCFGTEMFCHECVLRNHTRNPLHRIDVRRYFFTLSKTNIGL